MTFGMRLNLLSLLTVLSELVIPPSFKVLKIRARGNSWLKDAFNSTPNVEEEYEKNGWIITQETLKVGGFDKDWVSIKPKRVSE